MTHQSDLDRTRPFGRLLVRSRAATDFDKRLPCAHLREHRLRRRDVCDRSIRLPDPAAQHGRTLLDLTQHAQVSLGFNSNCRAALLAICLSCKFYDDEFCSNSFYAQVGLVDLREFNLMEHVFLSLVDFRLKVENTQFVCSQLKNFTFS